MPALRLTPSLGLTTSTASTSAASVSTWSDQDTPQRLALRAQAAARWRAMNATPQDLAQAAALTDGAKQAQAQNEQAQHELANLRQQMHSLEAQHRPLPWLAGAMTLLGVLGTWAWSRRQSGQSGALWRHEVQQAQQSPSQWAESAHATGGTTEPGHLSHATLPRANDGSAVSATPVASGLDLALDDFGPSALAAPAPATTRLPVRPGKPTAFSPAPQRRARAPRGFDNSRLLGEAGERAGTPSRTMPHWGPLEALREVSVEELIDLEQQADFFVVLGQEDAAIHLLETHVQHAADAVPLPYLKLLELYQRVGRREDYERVQALFNARFNGHAPVWEADMQAGQHLEDYPEVIERLQGLWTQPQRAMEVLEVSLTRPHDQVEPFDLPAYRELLMLYAVARDRADRLSTSTQALQGEAQVMGEEGGVTQVQPLTASRAMAAQPDFKPALAVDVRLDVEPEGEPVGQASARAQAGAQFTSQAGSQVGSQAEPGEVRLDFGSPATPTAAATPSAVYAHELALRTPAAGHAGDLPSGTDSSLDYKP